MVKSTPFALMICLLSTLLFFAPTRALFADEEADPTPEETPTEGQKVNLPPLFVAEIKGEVYVIHKGDKQKADPPQSAESDDRIVTGKDGHAYLEFKDGGTIEVGPDSDVKIDQLDITPKTFTAKFSIAWGKMKSVVRKLTSSSSTYEIKSGGVVTGVRGTVFEVVYDKGKDQVAAKTFEGIVYTKANGKEHLVEKGFGLVIGHGGVPVLSALSGEDLYDFAAFMDESTSLDKKKEILLKQLEKRLMNELLKKVAPKSPVDLQFHF